MRRISLLFGAVFLSLVIARALADETGAASLKSAAAAMRARKSLAGAFILTQASGGRDFHMMGSAAAMRPNLVKLDFGTPIDQSITFDGKSLWMYVKKEKTYMKTGEQPVGMMMPENTPFFYYLKPEALEALGANAKQLADETVEGVTYKVVQAPVAKPAAGTVKIYIAPDGLVQRTVQQMTVGGQAAKMDFTISSVDADKALTAADFAFTPPPGAKLMEQPKEPDYNAKLVPVGKPAPAFSLPTPKGGKLSLTQGLENKKALLVNFWFYN